MDYKLIPRSHHQYEGSREQADRLIAELMDRGYWLEASYSDERWTVTCGLERSYGANAGSQFAHTLRVWASAIDPEIE